jgi:tRNA threonylcarbamoyladenosine biosynthesis protein TsaB
MPLILGIETATSVCSVALGENGRITAIRESTSPNAHSAVLTRFIEDLFRETGYPLQRIDAIAVSMGPGSYTGLRIGVAAAKGLCYALGKPLIAVPTLRAMAEGMRDVEHESRNKAEKSNIDNRTSTIDNLYCPMIDARRMEVYCAVYDETLTEIRETHAEIIDENSFSDLLSHLIIHFAGDGAAKCRDLFAGNPHAVFRDNFAVSARYLLPLAAERLEAGRFEDIAYFEPYYLKDFVPGKPKVKGLNEGIANKV